LNCVFAVICLTFLFVFRQSQTRTLRAAMPIEIYPLEVILGSMCRNCAFLDSTESGTA